MKGSIHVASGVRISPAKVDIVTASLPIKRTHGEPQGILVHIFIDEKGIAACSGIEVYPILTGHFQGGKLSQPHGISGSIVQALSAQLRTKNNRIILH
jgi:hypothetical protein